MLQITLLLSLFTIAFAQGAPPAVPASADNGGVGGIFGIGMPSGLGSAKGNPSAPKVAPPSGGSSNGSFGAAYGGQGKEAVTGATLTDEQWWHPGTGPYPAKYFVDPTLPEKTIYAPKIPPPANVKMPVIVWGEGGCYKTGTFYAPFLLELASHGYIILANGPPGSRPPKNLGELTQLQMTPQNKVSDLVDSIKWALDGEGSKYGTIDTTKIATGGQSCGGTEALSAAYHNDNVKLTFVVNSGVLNPTARPLLNEFKYPIAWFNGGPKDIAFKNVSKKCPILKTRYLQLHRVSWIMLLLRRCPRSMPTSIRE
jgi:dienelactone hydrolase